MGTTAQDIKMLVQKIRLKLLDETEMVCVIEPKKEEEVQLPLAKGIISLTGLPVTVKLILLELLSQLFILIVKAPVTFIWDRQATSFSFGRLLAIELPIV